MVPEQRPLVRAIRRNLLPTTAVTTPANRQPLLRPRTHRWLPHTPRRRRGAAPCASHHDRCRSALPCPPPREIEREGTSPSPGPERRSRPVAARPRARAAPHGARSRAQLASPAAAPPCRRRSPAPCLDSGGERESEAIQMTCMKRRGREGRKSEREKYRRKGEKKKEKRKGGKKNSSQSLETEEDSANAGACNNTHVPLRDRDERFIFTGPSFSPGGI
jgi:hypothetical protein